MTDKDRDGWAGKMDGWMQLAAAIVKSGREAGDIRFLNSEWCQTLKEGAEEWAQIRIRDGHGHCLAPITPALR